MKLQEMIAVARHQGWAVSRTKKSHLKFMPPDPTKGMVIASTTPGDWRDLRNTLAQLRRRGLVIGAQVERATKLDIRKAEVAEAFRPRASNDNGSDPAPVRVYTPEEIMAEEVKRGVMSVEEQVLKILKTQPDRLHSTRELRKTLGLPIGYKSTRDLKAVLSKYCTMVSKNQRHTIWKCRREALPVPEGAPAAAPPRVTLSADGALFEIVITVSARQLFGR